MMFATIERISRIEAAGQVDVATVLGMCVVVYKKKFRVGQLVVFYRIGALHAGSPIQMIHGLVTSIERAENLYNCKMNKDGEESDDEEMSYKVYVGQDVTELLAAAPRF
jgi:hypothetical protein